MTMEPTGLANGEPAYRRIASSLEARIHDGRYAVGDLLPTELELCAEFSVSRHTVREALRRLADSGLIRAQQGRGTRVISSERRSAYVQSMRSIEGLFLYARDTRFEMKEASRQVPDEATAARLGTGEDEWVRINGVRYTSDGAAVCASTVYLKAGFADILDDPDIANGPLYQLIERRHRVLVDQVQQDFAAGPLPASHASALGVETGVPSVCVARIYMDADGRAFLAAFNHYPSDRFSYTMTLKREAGLPPPQHKPS